MEKRKNIYWYDKSMKRQRIMTTVIGSVGAVLLTVLTAALIILDLGYKSYKGEAKDKIASLEKDNLKLETKISELQTELDLTSGTLSDTRTVLKSMDDYKEKYNSLKIDYDIVNEMLNVLISEQGAEKDTETNGDTFTFGSTISEVKKAMGEPNKILSEIDINYSEHYVYILYYGNSTVTVGQDSGKVIGWNVKDTPLSLR